MKYEIEIPDGKYCNKCPMFLYEDPGTPFCVLEEDNGEPLQRDLELYVATDNKMYLEMYLKSINCPTVRNRQMKSKERRKNG